MSNSPLVSYTKISKNRNSPRNHVIDTITIHCVVGQCSVESLGAWFSDPKCSGSSNYGIGSDGRIGMYVEEKDRSWCSSNRANDNRAITIECASDMKHPYAINQKVYASLIDLCEDICRRNNIKELKWKADKSLIGNVAKQNMTVHRWFDKQKSCPGDYIYNRLGKIAEEVNARLNGVTKQESKKTIEELAKEVIQGKWGAGTARKKALTEAGYDYDKVQARVTELMAAAKAPAKKTIEELAKEVIQGKWGAGTARKKALTEAGYDYDKVQARVTELMKPAKKSIEEIAKEVIQGKWGAGNARKSALIKAGYDYKAVQKKVNELL